MRVCNSAIITTMFKGLLLSTLIPGLSALANPIITGIYEALPTDPAPNTTPFDYRAIEFFTEDAMVEQEFAKFFLRANFEASIAFPPFSQAFEIDLPFQPQGGAPTDVAVGANKFFYAIPLTALAGPAPFFAFYDAAWIGNPRIDDPPVLGVVDALNSGIAHEGDTKYTLMYDPDGDGDYSDATAIDTFGEETPFGDPTLYDNTFAYRKHNSGPDGGTFDISNWNVSPEDTLTFTGTMSELANSIPFGTFTIPEPGTHSLLLLGAAILLGFVRRRGQASP